MDPFFLEWDVDTQRGWDQPCRHAQRQRRHERLQAELAVRAERDTRRAERQHAQNARSRRRAARRGDLARKDQGAVSEDNQSVGSSVNSSELASVTDYAESQQQQQCAAQCATSQQQACTFVQPQALPKPKKQRDTGPLGPRMIRSAKRKAVRWMGRAKWALRATVDTVVYIVTAI